MQETRIRSLGGEDPLEKEMATHSSILAWKTPRTEEPGRPRSIGLYRVGHDLATKQQQQISFHRPFFQSMNIEYLCIYVGLLYVLLTLQVSPLGLCPSFVKFITTYALYFVLLL